MGIVESKPKNDQGVEYPDSDEGNIDKYGKQKKKFEYLPGFEPENRTHQEVVMTKSASKR